MGGYARIFDATCKDARLLGSARLARVLGLAARRASISQQRYERRYEPIWNEGGTAAALAAFDGAYAHAWRAGAGTPRVMHVIGSLAAGGAERQLVYLARESVRRGLAEASIVTTHPTTGAGGHYLPLALEGGVRVLHSGATVDPEAANLLHRARRTRHLLSLIPLSYRDWCVDLAGEFLRARPDVVHAWLDHANMWAGIAALAVGVPRIVLSTRNVSPSHFPTIDHPDFLPWYRRLARQPHVRLIANSRAGAEDYAAWMGIDPARFAVVLNGFDPAACAAPGEAELAALRRALGVEGRRVVLGVFRLADEKQPLVFAEVAARVLRAVPDAVVLVAGDGPMAGEMARFVRELDGAEPNPTGAAGGDAAVTGRLRLLGRREDVPALLAIADVVLHASRQEGTPNALLEAQALGCPVVATRGGGTVDAIEDGGSGVLCEVGDVAALEAGVRALLGDAALRARMSARARAFVRERFGLDRMVDDSVAVYRDDGGARGRR